MHPNVKKTIRDIQALKIQGARNVARAAAEALLLQARISKIRRVDAWQADVESAARALAQSRPTEPMMRNILSRMVHYAETEVRSVAEAKTQLSRRTIALLNGLNNDMEKLAQYGAALLPQECRVITHCHSSSVTAILRQAHTDGKKITVDICETRPRYQGRITAAELARAQIPVSFFVDGAMNLLMKNADIILVGADAVTSRGDLINKVGTATLAHIARLHDVSFYSAAELYKYSPQTFFGQREIVEERPAKEVWGRPPRGVHVRNPAFDVTAARYINGYITEAGILPPSSLFSVASEKLRFRI